MQRGAAAGHRGAFPQIEVTRADSVSATLAAHRDAFARHGLQHAWSRVIALVAQPGVDFDDRRVLDYDPARAAALGASILRVPSLVFEAHSTDYQTESALAALVRDHFAILKVGPALTFALREALFALTYIEDALFDDASERSQLRDVIDAAMRERPEYWAPYYRGDALAQRIARQFSYSDRIRYYWLQPAVAAALERLFVNLARRAPPRRSSRSGCPTCTRPAGAASCARAARLGASPDPGGDLALCARVRHAAQRLKQSARRAATRYQDRRHAMQRKTLTAAAALLPRSPRSPRRRSPRRRRR